MCVCVCVCLCIYIYVYICICVQTILGTPLPMKGLTTLVISMSTNLNVKAYSEILGNCVLLIL